jgi:chemotaxis receptor (MCP) glutamine deamidase CheD
VLQEFTKRGIPLTVSVAIAGGASLLASAEKGEVGSALVTQVKDVLTDNRLAVKLENVGGTKLRTMILNVDEGKIKIS